MALLGLLLLRADLVGIGADDLRVQEDVPFSRQSKADEVTTPYGIAQRLTASESAKRVSNRRRKKTTSGRAVSGATAMHCICLQSMRGEQSRNRHAIFGPTARQQLSVFQVRRFSARGCRAQRRTDGPLLSLIHI